VFSYAAPFSGVGTVAIRQSGKFQVAADAHEVLTDEGSVTPIRKRGRPSLADDPLRLVPLAVATLLHEWCPWQQAHREAGSLSWSAIWDLLRLFNPPGVALEYSNYAGLTSVKREVQGYRNDPSLQELVRSLDQVVIPTILRAISDR
jgi:hypothetical protein